MKIFELLLTPVFSARFSHCNKVSRAPLLPKGWRTGLPIDCNAFASSLVLLHYLRELPLVVRELLAVLCLLDWYVVMLHSTCYFHPSIIVPSCSHAQDIHERLWAACLCQAFSFCLLLLFCLFHIHSKVDMWRAHIYIYISITPSILFWWLYIRAKLFICLHMYMFSADPLKETEALLSQMLNLLLPFCSEVCVIAPSSRYAHQILQTWCINGVLGPQISHFGCTALLNVFLNTFTSFGNWFLPFKGEKLNSGTKGGV